MILALKQVQKGAELLMVIAAIYNRLRLASFLASFGEKSLDALGARFYQSKMARVAAKLYDKNSLEGCCILGIAVGSGKNGDGKRLVGPGVDPFGDDPDPTSFFPSVVFLSGGFYLGCFLEVGNQSGKPGFASSSCVFVYDSLNDCFIDDGLSLVEKLDCQV